MHTYTFLFCVFFLTCPVLVVCVSNVVGTTASPMYLFRLLYLYFSTCVCDMFVALTLCFFTFFPPILDIPLHALRVVVYDLTQLSVPFVRGQRIVLPLQCQICPSIPFNLSVRCDVYNHLTLPPTIFMFFRIELSLFRDPQLTFTSSQLF